ncbi:MAG TPA: ATP-binding protein [Acidobacteriota bacterium]|nr:ATP-binding protein [Acidobacteriota bacterium]HMZ79758.1 ATP-binding protein [Acidobacteriota bacterium]HNB70177.1 ATP-binding protein [Acidobacteriota bacterium]HNC42788.1 ATP-binding protein [Acidobacteriota bacterium]HND18109.1 ATP-binding protein [Acidobacteriota bacterium]
MNTAENVIELTIDSSYRFIELVAAVTDNITQIVGFPPEEAHWVGLAVRESVINAIKHGNQLDSQKPVDVRFAIFEQHIDVSIRDRGRGFDASHLPDPLDPSNLLNPNGRGIFYMRTFMDEVNFSTHPQGGTVVRMIKRKPETPQDADSDGLSAD